jgi:RHS repeat-associated protein
MRACPLLSPPRPSEGTLPTDYTFTGQRVDTSAGLMYYHARYYDAALGRFTQPDTIIPNPYNPQSLNRYSYVYNNPLRYTDPTGHCPYCLTVAIGTAVDVAFDFFIAQATKTSFNFGESVALNLGINAATAGIGGKVAKLRHLGKLAGLAEGAAKYGDEAGEIARRFGLSRHFSGEIAEEAVEKGLKSFTKDNFRENLMRLTGKSADEVADLEAHHVLPKEFIKDFQKAGLNIHDPTFGAWVDKKLHRDWSYQYNQEWRRFFNEFTEQGTEPSIEQILRLAQDLTERYRFDVQFTPY